MFKPGDKIRAIRVSAFTPCYATGDEFSVFESRHGGMAIHCHWSEQPHYLLAGDAAEFELVSVNPEDKG